jgi:Caspase domain
LAFIANYDHEDDDPYRSLLVIHYAGHGSVEQDDSFEVSGSLNASPTVSFTKVLETILDPCVKADILIILDCCFTGMAVRTSSQSRTIELIAASGAKEYTYSDDDSFSHYVDLGARELAQQGSFTIEALVRSLDTVKSNTVHSRPLLVNKNGQSYHTVLVYYIQF